jgi:hypothetical protein
MNEVMKNQVDVKDKKLEEFSKAVRANLGMSDVELQHFNGHYFKLLF